MARTTRAPRAVVVCSIRRLARFLAAIAVARRLLLILRNSPQPDTMVERQQARTSQLVSCSSQTDTITTFFGSDEKTDIFGDHFKVVSHGNLPVEVAIKRFESLNIKRPTIVMPTGGAGSPRTGEPSASSSNNNNNNNNNLANNNGEQSSLNTNIPLVLGATPGQRSQSVFANNATTNNNNNNSNNIG